MKAKTFHPKAFRLELRQHDDRLRREMRIYEESPRARASVVVVCGEKIGRLNA